MNMEAIDAYQHLRGRIIEAGYKHRHYDNTVAIAVEAQKLMSRDTADQKDEIIAYRIREDDEQKAQRIRLTNTVTSVAIAPVYAYFEEVRRTDGVKMEVVTNSESARARVEGLHANYYGAAGLQEYLHGALLHYNKYDPNAWLVAERRLSADGNTVEELYPVEVLSSEALDWHYDEAGILQYLAICRKRLARRISSPNGTKEMKDYYMYGPGYAWHFAEVDGDTETPLDYERLGYEPTPILNRTYMVRLWENGTAEVPAIRCGAYASGQHHREICETPVADAYPILRDLQRDKSYLDTSITLHTFLKLFEYVKPCNHVDEESNLLCEGGYYGGIRKSETRCHNCNGDGYIVHRGEQDVIRLVWPANAEDIVDLEKLSHYEQLPFDVVRFLKEQVQEAQRLVFMAVFNQETVDKALTVQTATEIRIEYDKIYNKLMPFAQRVAIAWEKFTRVAHQYLGDALAVADMAYPADFKLKNIQELTAEYAAAKDAGLSYDVLWGIQQDILQKQYRNMPQRVAEIRAFEALKPWKDKSPEEIAMILQRRAQDDPDRVLWENWSRVVAEIQDARGPESPFSAILDMGERRRVLYAKVAELIPQIVYASQASPFDAMLGLNEPQNVPADANQDGI